MAGDPSRPLTYYDMQHHYGEKQVLRGLAAYIRDYHFAHPGSLRSLNPPTPTLVTYSFKSAASFLKTAKYKRVPDDVYRCIISQYNMWMANFKDGGGW
jgi:hypothetical protein